MSVLAGLLGGGLPELLGKAMDKIFPDPVERDKVKLALLTQEGRQALDEMQLQLSAILAEANSNDRWTSRARPAFLYVMYVVIGLCFVGGIIGIWWPDQVTTAAQNINNLLGAIPEEMWWLFGTGYLGYTGARSLDKRLRGTSR
jgi:hypothetical protein